MTIFSNLIGDMPGHSQAVFEYADMVQHSASRTAEAETSLRSSRSMTPSWSGASADAYQESIRGQIHDICVLADGTEDGSKSLLRYAWTLRTHEDRVEELHDELLKLDSQYDAAPDKAAVLPALIRPAKMITQEYADRVSQAKEAAEVCAAELRNSLDLEPVNRRSNGTNVGASEELTEEDIERINRELENLNFNNVQQGSIGDCYYLSALMAVMQYDEGQDWLRSCISPHYDENGKQDGYLVTVYDDPLHPDEKAKQTVLVTDVYAHGATGLDGSPSVISIFESAYGQLHPGGTLDGSDGGITSGSRQEALQDVTNRSAHTIDGQDGYSQSEREEIVDALDQDHPATAGTGAAPSEHFENGKEQVEVELPNGSRQKIVLYHSHAYAIVDADENGVTLRNPHGMNRTPYGSEVDGTFTMSWEDFSYYYGNVTVGEIP
ncbi:C2 family cysteine protease [Actinobaculum sp. 313]|uniref:C2 family cysteine protease n=1 Tax=Actinobaculum sp. 313 TaxID=2495645 RepID=UPI000D52913C|nr:C2 family cysteine protease [Actinobaculum sp. 313]AWE43275.1 hypothetical protein DDD63_11540 [Actinobaculum sp. 313]